MILQDFAKRYNIDSFELLDMLKSNQYPVETVNDTVDEVFLEYFIEQTFGLEPLKNKEIFTKKSGEIKNFKATAKRKSQVIEEKVKNPYLLLRSQTVSQSSLQSQLSVGLIITFFLKSKKLYSINSVLSKNEIEELANEYKIEKRNEETVIEQISEKKEIQKKFSLSKDKGEKRPPIIVIVGHVDHGKTTLLDTIRSCSVAKNEKGGITQHLGAYVVTKNNKDQVFIDTPGHAAFTLLRSRGISIADIGILVVAADDGVMVQTIESINMLKASHITIIVAITKVDKFNDNHDFNKIYQQLSEHGILVEAWGGEVTVVFVSAIKKKGIDELLDVINIHGDLLDLKTNNNILPVGYVLESSLDKGLGPLSTIILTQGTLKIGDFFYVNEVMGRVAKLLNFKGESINYITASYPCVVSGADSLLPVGDMFYSADLKIVKKAVAFNKEKKLLSENTNKSYYNNIRNPFNIIIKADVLSSLHALKQSINEIKGDFFYTPVVVSASVGELTENDIILASQTHSHIYTFNKKCPSSLKSMMEKLHIVCSYYDVIYHLIEDLLKRIEKTAEVTLIKKKVGELTILKIFYIKNIGYVAGFKVNSGIVKQYSIVKIIRNGAIIHEGIIKSLQKERLVVKELTKGHEGALVIDKYENWQEKDLVEVYSEVRSDE